MQPTVRLPGRFFEPIAARFLVMATKTQNRANGPHFNRILIKHGGKDYDVTVSITEDSEGSVITLAMIAPDR